MPLKHFNEECFVMDDATQLYDREGRRLYLTAAERDAFLEAATKADKPIRTLCSVLYYTGCRISEALALTPRSIDLNAQTIIFETLKKRRRHVFRPVPVPKTLLDHLDLAHDIRKAHRSGKPDQLNALLWPVSRVTAWRQVSTVMTAAGIPEGPHRCPKGLRHGYAIHALGWGIPRWKPRRSTPTPSARNSRASPPGCGRDNGHCGKSSSVFHVVLKRAILHQ
jgi:integrase/recombinase XerD